MKKLLLLLLFSQLAIAQMGIEIRLVDYNIGTPMYNDPLDMYASHESNDPGLNAILQNYGVTSYLEKAGHPYGPYGILMKQITFSSPNVSQFITDLSAYSGVVASARIADPSSFSDALVSKIHTFGMGTPVSLVNNIVVTNDPGLNQIFLNNNVFFYDLYLPNGFGDMLKYYNIVCNCDNAVLESELDNYSAVIDGSWPAGAAYLSNNQFSAAKPSIYPNPFSTTFSINTKENISHYYIYDVSGKQLISTTSKTELDSQASQLNTGIYTIKLQSENGHQFTQKLIKK